MGRKYGLTHTTIPAFVAEDGTTFSDYTGLITYSESIEHGALQLGSPTRNWLLKTREDFIMWTSSPYKANRGSLEQNLAAHQMAHSHR
jgi:hypothetical protein